MQPDSKTGNHSSTPLAIVGIGCLFPKAAGPGFYWANVKQGVDCIGDVPKSHWNPDDYFDADPKAPDMTYARRGGFLDVVDFNPLEFGIAPRDIEATDTTQLLGLVAAKQALTDAGVVLTNPERERRGDTTHPGADASGSPKSIARSRVSVILGVTGTLELVIPLGARLGHPKWKRAMRDAGIPADRIDDAAARIAESYVPWQENSFPGLLGNVVAGRIANRLDLQGTNCVVDAACASSLSAVHLAAMELQTGRADVVVTGGCDTFNDIFMYMCFSKTPALSPTGNARPFEASGDGTILGEGLGVVVLKRLADAERAGDTIYAVLKGIGSSSDGKGNAIYAPSAEGQRRCLLNAYSAAGVTPDTIELVEAHGTGTRVGDATEATALTEVYGSPNKCLRGTPKPRPWCAIGSVKSQIGHTKAAAGAASLIKVALALHFKVLPPTIKVTQPVEPLAAQDSPFYVNTVMRPWLPRAEHPRRAGLSAFGFGGSNFHAVLEEHHPHKTEVDWDGSVEVVALGVDTPQLLAAELAKVPTPWAAFARFAEASRTAFKSDAPCRLAFAAHRTLTDLPKLLAGAKARLTAEPNAATWHTPEGVHFGRGSAPGSLAVLFPGQGSQSVGMLRDLACLFPEMLDSLAAADAAVAAQSQDESDSRRLSDRIYPPTSFDPKAKERNDAELRDTGNAQPALGAVSYGAWRTLSERFGVAASAFAGHSYGELVALAAAGRLSQSDLFTLSRIRGKLMGERRGGDPGTMLAVLAPLPDIERVLADERLNLVVANRNAPKQTVLSGATPEVERAVVAFNKAKIKTARFPVAAAFHSPFVSEAAIPFRAALDVVEFAGWSTRVFANTTATEYPEDAVAARELLANQLAKPVAFVEQVRAMAVGGARTFVEVGPGAVLTRLAEAILADAGIADAEAFALDASGGKQPGVFDLAKVLARFAAHGYAVELTAWEAGSRCRPPRPLTGKAAMTVPLTGANHVNHRTPRPPAAPLATSSPTPGSNGRTPAVALSRPIGSLPRVTGMSTPDPNALAHALQTTQQSLASLQRMQEQTAALHKQFLESQEAAQRTLHALVEQQQMFLLSGLGTGVALPAPTPPRPAPARVGPPAPVAQPAPVVRPPAPVPPPPVGPAPVAVKPKAPAQDRVASALLSVVSEKTGYPVESLDLSLSLDADLGVDSIKRVEILSALQERLPDAPQVKPEHLGSLHTLKDVADFLTGPGPANGTPGVATDVETLRINKLREATAEHSPTADARKTGTVDVASALLSVVSEKTGYPVESLDLSLSLDADLGVDSIKRVEILSALQERLPDAPQVKPEHLGSLHTLKDVADFLTGPAAAGKQDEPTAVTPTLALLVAPQSPERKEQAAEQKTAPAQDFPEQGRPQLKPATRTETAARANGTGSTDRVDRSIVQIVDLDPASPRPRVPLAAGDEIWVVGDPDTLTEVTTDLLAAQGFVAKAFGWSGPAPLKIPGTLAGLILLAPISPEPGLNRKAFEWLKLVAGQLRQAGRVGAAVLVTVSRLDGAFGFADLTPDADPTSGGLAGLAKTARHEWSEVSCKAVDLSPAVPVPEAAAALVAEVLAIGPVEVGIAPTHLCTLELARTVRRPSGPPMNLGPKDVILVTGGARGVTAETAIALAEAYSSTLVLTGRTALHGPEPEWLAPLTTEADIKRVLTQRLGADAGPKQVGEQYSKLMAQREVRRTLQRVEQTGARVAYFPLNITDGKAVADLLHQVRMKFGPVTALVHGAGVLADRRLEDLTGEQFERVYSTKVEGVRHLLDLLANDELKALVLFSSTTARLGRVGQAAYACANEVLNKTAQVEARRRPGCRVVAINWGPWDGGMVTPGLRKVFESEGVGLIPMAEGAAFLVQELTAGKAVEVVSLGKKLGAASGVVPQPAPAVSGGIAAAEASAPVVAVAGSVPANPDMVQAFEWTVDVETHPVLKSHVIDGRSVLPMALHLEWLAHAAMHGNPGLLFHGFNDLRVTAGVQIDGNGSAVVRAFAGKAVKQDKLLVVPVELRGRRKDGREVIHSRAEIVLATALPPTPPADKPPPVRALLHSVPQAYQELLFHGPVLQGIRRIEGISESAFIGTAAAAPPPAEWLSSPLRSSWVADPLVLDVSFQMMIIWTQTRHKSASLPCFAGRYRQFRKAFPADPTTVVIRVSRDDGIFARADIDYLDAEGRVVAQMQDYECLIERTLNQAFRKNQVVRQ